MKAATMWPTACRSHSLGEISREEFDALKAENQKPGRSAQTTARVRAPGGEQPRRPGAVMSMRMAMPGYRRRRRCAALARFRAAPTGRSFDPGDPSFYPRGLHLKFGSRAAFV